VKLEVLNKLRREAILVEARRLESRRGCTWASRNGRPGATFVFSLPHASGDGMVAGAS